MVISDRNSTGYFSLDLMHWAEVRKARLAQGLPLDSRRGPVLDHPLVGACFAKKESGQAYTVQSVSRDWFGGWLESALLVNSQGSHASCVLSAQGVAPDFLHNQVSQFSETFQRVS